MKKDFKVSKLSFSNAIEEGESVNVVGFYDKSSTFKNYENRVSGYRSSEHTYELQNHLTSGLSGSPILKHDKVCGVATAINSKKNLTYVIPISEVCVDLNLFEKAEEESYLFKFKMLNLADKGIIIGIVGTVAAIFFGSISLLSSNNTAESDGNSMENITVNNSRNVTFKQENGKVDISPLCREGEKMHEDTIVQIKRDITEAKLYEDNTPIEKLKQDLFEEQEYLAEHRKKCD